MSQRLKLKFKFKFNLDKQQRAFHHPQRGNQQLLQEDLLLLVQPAFALALALASKPASKPASMALPKTLAQRPAFKALLKPINPMSFNLQ